MILTNTQTDALKELGNIGAAHAATTLSTMLMTPIEMNVPEIFIVDLARVHQYISDDPAAMVLFQINGDIAQGGYLLLHVPEESAIRLVNVMLGQQDHGREFNEMDRSALLEIGNIMVSAFLDGCAGLLNTIMLPSPPDMVIDMPHAALQSIIASQLAEGANEVVLFQTELKSAEHFIKSNILLLPNPPMLSDIIQRLERLMYGG
jgi:chemotaxis protein CheY-P-specific phosphatase CheC